MLVATLIDATDGTLARMVRIKETLPGFDGRRLDDLVDFLMYTCLPLLMIHRADLLPSGCDWVLIVALMASAYGFSQSDVKTADGAFLGFPSYWNIVAFYLYALPVPGGFAVAALLGFSFLTFVPSRYPYTTQPGRVNRLLLVLSVPWGIAILVAVLLPWDDGVPRDLVRASAAYPLLYLGVAWGMSLWRVANRERIKIAP
jgi:phosphatidylcholine synthase